MPRLLVGAMNRNAGDDDDADDVPPHADVAEDLDEVDAERVEQTVHEEHQEVDPEDRPTGELEAYRRTCG